ncbi:MAG: branched chain amino acid ABC transporter substrate-binding protein [Actinobacteria bacterium HGW-Actinobacteria-1]|jgi:branched-chain amino acid transport system substrate-binding protein|nr:MAG: branched chain amino acid ABC transporter substrate-binding protein [Actinobacteria bacterium HGW-Actinobacteria-1]
MHACGIGSHGKDSGMRNTRHKALALLLVAAVAATGMLAGCSAKTEADSGTEPAKQTTVKIGFAAPLTGDNAVYGEGMKRAVEMAIEEANASDEVKAAGYTYEISAQDDQADPKQAVNVANLLDGDAGVVALVGHFNSGCSIPASAVYERAGLAMVSVSSNPQLTAQGFAVVNRIVAKDDAQGTFAADLVYDTLGYKKVAVLDDSTPYGTGLATEFVKRFKEKGGEVVVQEKVQSKEVDFSAVVTRVKAAAPQALYYGGAHTEGALIAKQAKEAGLNIPVIGGDMLFSPEYIKIARAENAEGDICTSLGLPLDQQPKGTEFKAAYNEKYGKDPEAYDSYAYDSAWIIIKAVLEAGPDRAAVATAIRGLSYDGVTGTTSFDANGDTKNQAISAYRVTGGEWKQIVE